MRGSAIQRILTVDSPILDCIGTKLVNLAVDAMAKTCDEVVLETEVTNKAALRLYEKAGFVRDKLLTRYYLNGNDAYRLKVCVYVCAVSLLQRSQYNCDIDCSAGSA